jgi:hypothetical protein
MLDTSGYIGQHVCRMVARPEFRNYNANQAVVSVRWMTTPLSAVQTLYATSWPYPVSLVEEVTGSAVSLGGKEWPVLGEQATGCAEILGGFMSEPIRYATMDDDEAAGGAAIIGGFIREITAPYDLRTFDTERATGSASILSGVIDTILITYDMRTFDTDAATGGGSITGGTIS